MCRLRGQGATRIRVALIEGATLTSGLPVPAATTPLAAEAALTLLEPPVAVTVTRSVPPTSADTVV